MSAGATLLVSGSSPLRLDDAARCYRILSGDVQCSSPRCWRTAAPARASICSNAARATCCSYRHRRQPAGGHVPCRRHARYAGGGTDARRSRRRGCGPAAGAGAVAGVMSRAIAGQILPRPRFDEMLAAGETRTLKRDGKVSAAHSVLCAPPMRMGSFWTWKASPSPRTRRTRLSFR